MYTQKYNDPGKNKKKKAQTQSSKPEKEKKKKKENARKEIQTTCKPRSKPWTP